MAKFSQYQMFVSVVNAGSLSAAAEQLHLSVAAVSKKLAALELHLGAKLIIRSTRHFEVTPQGEAFYRSCCDILQAVVSAEEEISKSTGEPAGTLKVSLPQILIPTKYLGYINDFASQHPKVKLDLEVSNKPVDLSQQQCDFSLRVGKTIDKKFHRVALAKTSPILVVSPGYIFKNGMPKTLKQIGQHRFLLPPLKGLALLKPVLEVLDKENHQELDTINDTLAYYYSILNGQGIGIIQRVMVEDVIQAGLLKELFPGAIKGSSYIQLLSRKQTKEPSRYIAFRKFMVAKSGEDKRQNMYTALMEH